ncbi:MAG: TetR/AcrR family transcriptional regulator [Acidimicrobiales bacterium]
MAQSDVTQDVKWHDRTLERSLQNARARAISRGDRFIRAAAGLLRERGRPDFTVQEVVERSGMSLRSFYHHFATKDDLLLALIEESVRSHHKRVRAAVAKFDDPIDQLQALVTTYYGGPEDDDPASKGMAIFHLHLAESRSAEYMATFEPQTDLLVEIFEQGRQRGQIRTDLQAEKLAAFVTQVLASAINTRVLGVQGRGAPLTADDLWLLIKPAVTAPEVPSAPRARSRAKR